MKGKRRLLGVLMIIGALIIMQLPVKEADAATSASPFKMEGTKLVKYRGTEKNVSIPGTVEVIGKGAFEENDTVEVIAIPASVKRIDSYAFWGCDNLEKVIIGTGLTEIGDYAFTNCVGLTDITIPSNIRRIGIQAFAGCVNMTEITIPFQVTEIHETAFDGCYKLVIDCERGTYADEYAQEFYEKQKEMPEYEDVPGYTGGNQNDTTGTTPAPSPSVTASPAPDDSNKNLLGSTYIVDNQAVVFLDNKEPTVYGSETTPEPVVENEKPDNNSESTAGENAEDKKDTIEISKSGITKYCVVDGRVIADQAYYQNNKLKELHLPDGIEEIGEFSFARSSLESIKLPDTLTTVSYGAFYHCDKLSQVTLPESIMNIEPKAFAHTAWVKEFLCGSSKENTDFLISNGVLVAYRGNTDKVVIPEGVRVIAAEAFMNHSEIVKLELPESLLVIGEGAFEGCNSITQLTMGEKVEKIKDRAFLGCKLAKIRLPKGVKELGLKAFDDTVKVSYDGAIPNKTYETTAQRLSNESYRNYGKLSGEQGVVVEGIKRAYAELSGAKKCYTLAVEAQTQSKKLEAAFRRNLNTQLPVDAELYTMELTDGSDVSLTKLGKQMLTVTLPVSESFKEMELIVYTLDRNGQLELLNSKEVRIDGTDSVQFETDYVSEVAICTTGIATEEVSIVSMSGPAADNKLIAALKNNPMMMIKWLLVATVLILGIGFALKKSK